MSEEHLRVIQELNWNDVTTKLIDTSHQTEYDAFVYSNPLDTSFQVNFEGITDVSVFTQKKLNVELTNEMNVIVNEEIYPDNRDRDIRELYARDILLNKNSDFCDIKGKMVVLYGNDLVKSTRMNFNLGNADCNGLSKCPENPTKQIWANHTPVVYQLSNNIGYGGLPGIITVLRGGFIVDFNNPIETQDIGKMIRESYTQSGSDTEINCQNILNHNSHYCTSPIEQLSSVRTYLTPNQSIVIAPCSIIQGYLQGMLHHEFIINHIS